MSQMLPELFDALGEDAATAMEDGAEADARFFESTADNEDTALQRIAENERQLAQRAEGAGAKATEDAAGTPDESGGDGDPGGEGGSGLRGTTDDPASTARDLDGRTLCADPIDVASGEMVLARTDVALDGELPLILSRVHLSAYRSGRLFGPSWASTLDQRLEWDSEGICFAGEDGTILFYPSPRPGETVLPAEGARWPLTWDGQPDAPVAITDPRAGITRRFAGLDGRPPSAGSLRTLLLRTITNRNGDAVEFDYDSDGTPVQVRHSGGYRIGVDSHDGRITGLRLLADAPGYETALTGAPGSLPLLQFGYDGPDLAEVRNASGLAMVYRYDAHRITSWTDRNGTEYHYRYDDLGRVVSTTGSGGYLAATLSYDPFWRSTVVTNSLGQRTRYHYDERNRVTRVTDPAGHTVESVWDRYGRLLAQTDALDRTLRFGYDETGNRIWAEQPTGMRCSTRFGDLNLPLVQVAPDGNEWRYDYDSRGNLLSVTDPSGAVRSYGYDAAGHLASATDPLGHTVTLDCDPAGLPVRITGPSGAVKTLTRDAFGRVVATTDPVGGTVRLGWTVSGQVAWQADELGAREEWAYDPEDNLVRHRDAAGGTTEIDITHFDLAAARTGPDGARYEFGYDTELRLVTVTGPDGLQWRYDYDPAGNVVTESDFSGLVSNYSYDAAGQLTGQTTAGGRSLAYRYDDAGQVVEQRAGDQVTTFAYDPMGWLSRAANPDVEIAYERDELGRVLTETVNGASLRNGYDAAGQRIHRRTPAGVESDWSFGPTGAVAALRGAQTLEFEYDQAGRETARRFGQQISVERSWDAAHRLTAVTSTGHPDRAQDPDWVSRRRLTQQHAYQYRADGYPTGIDDDIRGPRRFTLDPAGRVTRESTGVWADGEVVGNVPRVPFDDDVPWTGDYRYDAAGSLVFADVTAPGADPGRNGARTAQGLLTQTAGQIRYTHDADGRPVRCVRPGPAGGGDQVWTYTWNDLNQLTGVITPDGTAWRYVYDPLGRRTAKQRLAADGTVAEQTRFTWDQMQLAEQVHEHAAGDTAGADTLTWDYEPGTDTPLAQTTGRQPGSAADQAQTDRIFYAIVTDLVGTPAELVHVEGAFAWRASSDLWGNQVRRYPGDTDCPLRFPGQYYDAETGWHYNLYRYYNPATGGYVTPDPLGLLPSPNPLAYVPNPLTWIDPWGLAECLQTGDATWKHIFQGDVKYSDDGKGTASGYHFRPGGEDYNHGYGVKSNDFSDPDPNGVYRGTVHLRDWRNNDWVTKTRESTFFPSNWSRDKVMRAVNQAIRDGRITDPAEGRWQGVYHNITIRGYFDPTTKVVKTAFPVMSRR